MFRVNVGNLRSKKENKLKSLNWKVKDINSMECKFQKIIWWEWIFVKIKN